MGYFISISFVLTPLVSCNQTMQKNGVTKETFNADYLYKSKEEKGRFLILKEKFLEVWSDSSNCYRGQSKLQNMWWQFYKKNSIEITIDNILSTGSGDTLVFLMTGYAVNVNADSVKTEKTDSIGMGVIIDSLGLWHFNCDGGTFWISSPNENQANQILELRDIILDAGYLDENGSPSPVFWKKLYNNELFK